MHELLILNLNFLIEFLGSAKFPETAWGVLKAASQLVPFSLQLLGS